MEEIKSPRPESLEALLALDTARRVVGIANGLIPLEDLVPQSWDFSAPTLVSADNSTYAERTLCPDTATFAAEFYKAYPVLEGVPLGGLLIAGSSVGQFIPRVGSSTRAWPASDVDIFVYGHKTPADSRARIEAFINDLDLAHDRRAKEALAHKIAQALRALSQEQGTTSRQGRSSSPSKRAPRGSATSEGDAARWACERLLALIGEAKFERANDQKVMRPPASVEGDEWEKITSAAPRGLLSYPLPDVEVVRTAGSITISVDRAKIQLVLRHYAEKSEVLHGFDLGASAAGFDGAQVWLTELGRFAYEHGYNVVDTTRRSTTYEARLWKYTNRGFDLILPRLNLEALSRRNLKYNYSEVADLPLLPFAYKKIEGNRIFLDRFVKTFGPASDYDLSEEVECGGFALAYMNLHRLVNGETNFIYSAEGAGFLTALNVLRKPPHLTLRMLQRLYDQFRASVWDGSRLNVRTLARYVPDVPVRAITKEVYVDGKDTDAVLDKAFATQRAAAMNLWNRHIRDADHSVLPWVTENPGGQESPLTGSLNPIIEDPATWYGEYLAPDGPAM